MLPSGRGMRGRGVPEYALERGDSRAPARSESSAHGAATVSASGRDRRYAADLEAASRTRRISAPGLAADVGPRSSTPYIRVFQAISA